MEDTVESLRQVAPHWSLAGDHKLLDILQTTHQRIISKCKEVMDQLDVMVASLDDASITLQNVNNRFMALSNSQFIESRVYDDDTDVATETSPVKEPPKPSSLESDLQSLKRGLQVLEDAHETLTILHDSDTDTDSEDEAAARTVLRPRDLYSERPLPYIIGTQPWRNKWHAGLVQSDSESEGGSRPRSQYSDSEPDSDPPRTARDVTISETSSERLSVRDESPPPARHQAPAPHQAQAAPRQAQAAPRQAQAAPRQAPADVAAELARRLGGQPPKMPERDVDYEPPPAMNKVYKPRQPTTGPVFPDEPPPLSSSASDDEDIFADLHKSQPGYSTSRGAADLFRFPHERGGDVRSPGPEEDDIFSDFAKPVIDPSAKRPPLFPEPRNMFPEQRNMFPNKTQPVPNTRDTVDDSNTVKKPVGAISLFGSNKGAATIGAAILKRNRKPSTSSDAGSGSDAPATQTVQTKQKDIFDDLFAKSQKINKENVVKDTKTVVKKPDVAQTKVDLFSDNIFDDIDDIFTTNVVEKPVSAQKSIFDDEDELFSEIAAPKTVKSDVVSSDNKKSLFESDDDELFGDKSKSISKDEAAASGSTKISKHNEEITKRTEIIRHDSSKEIISTNNSTKISNQDEKVTTNVETNTDSTKISNIFDDDNDEDIFSNVKTNNSDVQNKFRPKIDKTSKPDKSFRSPSLFDDDDDDDDLFTTPAQSSKTIQKDTAIDTQANTRDIFGITDDDLFVGATKTSNITQKDTAGDETDRVIKSDDVLNTTVKNKAKNSKKHDSTSDVNIDYTINSDVTKSVIKDNGSDDDFEQDFDDLPTSEDTNLTSQSKNIITETKPSDIFDNTGDLFAKPAQKHIDNNEASSIDKPKFIDTQSSSKITDNTLVKETITDNVPDVTDKTHIESYSAEDLLKTRKNIPIITDNIETSTETNKNTGKRSKTPENIFTQTEKHNNKAIIDHTDIKTGLFDDIFTEPPAFEKPREPKRSKNVNALFDDDSDDEALFFKKNDVITDEKPDDFKLNQDRFDIFIDEPPEVDVDAKIGSDDELFSSLPVIPKADEDTSKNEPKDTSIQSKSTETSGSLYKNELDRGSTADDDIFDTLPKPSMPRASNENLGKNTVASSKNLDINTPKNSQNVNISQDTAIIANKSSINVATKVNEVSKSDSDDDIFKTLPKTTINPVDNKEGSDEDLFRLPKAEKPVLKSEKTPDITNKHTTILKTNDTDDDELFKSSPKSEKKSSLPGTAINKSEESTSQSDGLFKPLPKDIAPLLPKDDIKGDSDEDLFRTLPKNITLPQNQLPQTNLGSNSEESPKKVGKLKTMNFNINVNALLPGASPKKQALQSPTEPQKPDSKIQTEHDSNAKSEQEIDSKDSNVENPDPILVKSVSFEDEPESGILDNKLSKERAKIQVKRRPSTRRARREAVRKSAIDLGDDSTDNSSSIDDLPKTHKHHPGIDKTINKTEDLSKLVKNTEKVSQKPEKTSSKSHADDKNIPDNTQTVIKTEYQPEIAARPSSRDVNTKIVYILNDEDIFNTPALPKASLNTLGNIYTEKNGDKIAKIAKDEAISTRSNQDNSNKVSTSSSQMSNATKGSKTEADGVKKSIFDSDSDGELFAVKREVKKVVKGPLFSDDDDDDLFGVKKNNEPKQQASRTAAVKEPQKPAEPVFDDPLSLLGDDD